MATPNTNYHHNLFPLLTVLLTLLSTITTSSAAADNFTEFTFDTFEPSRASELIFQGDANISSSSNTLQLTSTDEKGNPMKKSVGRVLYSTPIHLWKKSEKPEDPDQVSTFETTFTFVVNSTTREIIGDGLTFFMASVDSTIPENSGGGFFGLFNETGVADPPDQILAVEFDTYIDGRWDPNYDPSYRHIGIDVNTIRSSADIPWDRKPGKNVTAAINYNPHNKKLYVKSYYSDDQDQVYWLSSSVELDVVLTEYVMVGFSASTGDSAVETHNILSWTFSSWLHNVTAFAANDSVTHASSVFSA